MERRFETADGKEQAIRRFEEAQQQPDEALSSYLFRLRQMADYAFAKEVPGTKRSRVLWRFIAGMNNDFARQEVLRHKLLTAEGKPKEDDEILNVAEEARSIQMGMRAAVPRTVTGENDCLAFASQWMEQSCACQRIPERQQVVSRGQRAQRRTTTSKRGIECWYCDKIHWGGYRNCWQRARENPQWKPQQHQTRHNAGPTTTTAVLQVSGHTLGRHRQFGMTRKRLLRAHLFLSRECWISRT